MDHQKKAVKNEAAVEQLADILEPAIAIFSDAEVKEKFGDDDAPMVGIVVFIMKKYAKEIVQILASLDGIPYEEADYTTAEIIKKCLNIAKDDELMGFFSSLR